MYDGNTDFNSRKYVGKTIYKAPEVYAKREIFDARLADCWSLGVAMFCMVRKFYTFIFSI